MNHPLLRKAPHQPAPHLPVLREMKLALGRVHEICGAARHRLALMAAARLGGPIIWIRPGWLSEALNPDGMRPLIDPGRLIFVEARQAEDLLWCAEESLRAGAVSLVVAELPQPPALTPIRRLHLAAETGAAAAPQPPLGLLLLPAAGGAPGVESRWSLTPAHEPAAQRWRLERLRARTSPPAAWQMAPGGALSPAPHQP